MDRHRPRIDYAGAGVLTVSLTLLILGLLRIGIRATACAGAVVVVLGSALLLLLDESASVVQVGATSFVIGLGMGFTAAPTLIAAQSAVGWQQRGVVTGTNMFFRSAGSAVGVAVFGALVNATLGRTGVDGESVDPHALTTAVHSVILATTVLAVVMLVGVLLMPRDRGQVGEAGRQTERPANAAARR